jgi:hypothetical protein
MKLTFPSKGKFVGTRSGEQPMGTSRDLNNVRPWFDGRSAGGQRDGLAKKYSQQGAGVATPVVAICTVTVVS